MIPDEAVEATTRIVYAAQWRQMTPEEASRQILEHLHPTIWPRRSPGYGNTGTRRLRKVRK